VALEHVPIESRSEMQEIKFAGDWAYCWNHLWVTVTPRQGKPQHREGFTLSIFGRNPKGTWLLVRDANMLTLEPEVSPPIRSARRKTPEPTSPR
jgi:ketosteroid isomerase-like protein